MSPFRLVTARYVTIQASNGKVCHHSIIIIILAGTRNNVAVILLLTPPPPSPPSSPPPHHPLTTPSPPWHPPGLTTPLTTPLTTLLTTLLATLLAHHPLIPPHHSPLPILFTTLPNPTTPSPHPSPCTTLLKGAQSDQKTRKKSSFYVCKPFQDLPITSNIIFDHFLQKKFWDKIDQKLEYDGGGGAHVLNCTRITSSIHFSTCNILLLKNTLISHFQVLFV